MYLFSLFPLSLLHALTPPSPASIGNTGPFKDLFISLQTSRELGLKLRCSHSLQARKSKLY